MADETETSIETSTETQSPTANDAVETSALGGAGTELVEMDGGEAAGVEAAKDGETGKTVATVEVPDAYELSAPEGLTLDAKDVELATPVFKELGLSNEAANKLMPVAAQFAKNIADRLATEQLGQVTAWRKEQFAAAQADPEIGGAKWDESLTYAAKALDTFGATKGSPFRNALDESGWGNHPEMIRMFSKIGRAVGEDTDFVRGDVGAPVEQNPARILYPNDPPKGA